MDELPAWGRPIAVIAAVAAVVVGGRYLIRPLFRFIAASRLREIFTATALLLVVAVAALMELVGLSPALGAFLAGVVLSESDLSHQAAADSLPLQDAFAVLFFVSVGMLFDPRVIIEQPLQLLATVLIIILGKSLAAFALVLALRYPLHTALTVSASLAQIGEFSFILVGLGLSLGLLPQQAQSLVLAGAIISIALNPFTFRLIEPLRLRLQKHSANPRRADPLAELPASVPSEKVTGQVVLVGYGRVGRRIAETLALHGTGCVVVEQNREIVQMLRQKGAWAVAGNAAEPAVLIQAHIARASALVIATPDTFHVRAMIETARILNPGICTLVRTHSEEEARLLRQEKAGEVFIGEQELAKGMSHFILERLKRQGG